jgi:hypothetical protein
LGITVYSRFLNLNWDSGWGFHPDENNLWGASRTIKWFSSIDPKFYAYGGFPIYLYSFFDSKVQARAVSALLQTAIIGLLFLTGRKLKGEGAGFLAAWMGIFSAGLIQASHFLTVESLIGFFSLLTCYSMLNYFELINNPAGRHRHLLINFWLISAAVALGFGVGTKISFVVFALPLLATVLRSGLFKKKAGPLLALSIVVLIFLLTNPFIFVKFQDVKSTLRYETNVAMGNLPVFYTRQFIGTIPGWFQTAHIFPYITGWLFTPIFFIGVFVICFKESPCRTARRLLMVSIIAALLSFIPMWAKWTRYVVQVLPILILTAAIGADWLWEKGKAGKAVVILLIISFLPQFFSIMKVYSTPDNRLAAADWAAVNIPKNAKIFTEGMDLGIIPFNPVHGEDLTLFNFYELDDVRAEEKQRKLDNLINESDYFILLSRRVYKNSFDRPDKFPRAAEFYRRLFDGSLGYKKIYEPIMPSAFILRPSSLLFPEETFEVFDHPTILIFRKVNTFLRS